MHNICHFEIPADDVRRAKKFYTELFGWKIEDYPDMEYWMIHTSGEKGEGLGGGLFKRSDPKQSILNYVDVADVAASALRVEKLGGKIVVPKSPVPGMGWFAVCLDTENNPFALWETDKNAK